MDRSDLAIIIPAFNEAETVAEVVEQAKAYGRVIVVNDASTDKTAEKAAQAGAHVITHAANAGYDAALNTGFDYAAGLDCKYAITIDADGQHDPALIGDYYKLLQNSADLVLGVRSHKRLLSEYIFAGITRLVYGVHDPLCGMKGYRLTVYRTLGHFDCYQSIGSELALFGVREGFKFIEVPLRIRDRRGKSRFGWGLRANYKVLRSIFRFFALGKHGTALRNNGPLFLTVDPQDPVSLHSARAQLGEFFRTRNGHGQAVSFLQGCDDAFEQVGAVQNWRGVFGEDEDFRLWSEAYDQLNRIMSRLPESISGLINTYYHECARDFFQSLVLLECEQRFGDSLALLVPADGITSLDAKDNRKTFRPAIVVLLGSGAVIALALKTAVFKGPHFVFSCIPRLGFRITNEMSAPNQLEFRFRLRMRGLDFAKALAGLVVSKLVVGKRLARSAASKAIGRVRRTTALTYKRPDAVVITIEDSGTRVNLNPGLKILRELKDRGENVIVLSSYDGVIREVKAAGAAAVNVTALAGIPFSSRADAQRKKVRMALTDYPAKSAESLFLRNLDRRIHNYLRSIYATKRVLAELETRVHVRAVLSIYESLPLSAMVGLWAIRHKIPWVGFFPILVGDRPDGNHFPAPLHLVYGDQLKEKMLSHGCEPNSIRVVGTPTFDAGPPRDRERDRARIAEEFPHTAGKPLVVVATEAFPLPLVELQPILESLARMDDVAVVLKVHPSDSPQFFESFVSSLGTPKNIRVVHKCDLLALLHSADLLIAIVSNIIVTAAVLGTPALVCDFSGKSKVVNFVAEGLCDGCYDAEQISESVRRLLFDSAFRAKMLARLAERISRFNGPNDGNSHKRIASFVQSLAKDPEGRKGIKGFRMNAEHATGRTSEDLFRQESRFEGPIMESKRRG